MVYRMPTSAPTTACPVKECPVCQKSDPKSVSTGLVSKVVAKKNSVNTTKKVNIINKL